MLLIVLGRRLLILVGSERWVWRLSNLGHISMEFDKWIITTYWLCLIIWSWCMIAILEFTRVALFMLLHGWRCNAGLGLGRCRSARPWLRSRSHGWARRKCMELPLSSSLLLLLLDKCRPRFYQGILNGPNDIYRKHRPCFHRTRYRFLPSLQHALHIFPRLSIYKCVCIHECFI